MGPASDRRFGDRDLLTAGGANRSAEDDLRFLARASEVLAGSLDYETTLTTAARLAVPFLADQCVIDLLHDPAIRPIAIAHVDPDAEALLRAMRQRYPLDLESQAPVARVMRSGKSLLFPVVSDSLQESISQSAEHHAILRRLNYHSAIVAPLVARGETIGTIMLVRVTDTHRYDERDLELAEELARRAADAIDNARLYASELAARQVAEQAVQRLEILQSVTAAFSRALTAAEVAAVVIDRGLTAIGADSGVVYRCAPDGETLEVIAHCGSDERPAGWRRVLRDAPLPAADVVRTGEAVWLANHAETAARYPSLDGSSARARASAMLPLEVEGRVIGSVGLTFPTERAFPDGDRHFLTLLAQQCAQALERARLFEAEQAARAASERTGRRLARLQAVTAAFSRAVTPADVAEIVVRESMAALSASVGSILLLTPDGQELEMVAAVGYPQKIRDTWQRIPMDIDVQATEAVRTGHQLWIESREDAERRFPLLRTTPTTDARAFAALPLVADDRPIGVMGLSFPDPRAFSEDDRTFVTLLTQQGAQALERARLYQAESEARAAAEAAARDREEFLSIAAHELKTPLTTIKGFVQLLRRTVREPEPEVARIADFVVSLESQVVRLEGLVADLLDISRLSQGLLALEVDEADLTALAAEVLRQIADAPEHLPEHQLRLEAPGPVLARIDARRVEQVLVNLLSNALKYSPNGGAVTVRLRVDDDQVEITVEDEGIGIAPDEQSRVFEPFMRSPATRRSVSGTGLGLAISARIVDAHGGTIVVSSTPGRGSAFTMRLPLDGPASAG